MFAMVNIFQGDAKKKSECAVGCGGVGISQNIQEKHSIHQRAGRVHCCQSTSLKLPQILISFIYVT